ncbi:Nucleolar protein gar2-like protein [Thalictrum thalictroides]|uniref:Nucleolar protein gar2-like protein n=1 Tax=Thalictrum thalictroides TaxID=46969 RepID=A0A7J6VRE3_THATH|nr:Nucleolar protein gar2-like protein [Thalictrum thalictroides]
MVAKEMKDDLQLDNHSNDIENKTKEEKEEESDCEPVKETISSQGGAQTTANKKVESTSRAVNKPSTNGLAEGCSRSSRERTNKNVADKKQNKSLHSTPKKSVKTNGGLSKVTTKNPPGQKSQKVKIHPKPSSESSEGLDDSSIDEVKEIDLSDEVPNGSQSIGSDDESAGVEEHGLDEDQELVEQRIEDMELRIEKLEEELREIAALEISLYSVVPEHGSSAHKVHTPARRLSRLYIYACKHWTQDKRASIAKNTASGLVLVAKSCGNDVPRLTFWLSNTVVLREILSQAFGNSLQSSMTTRIVEANGGSKSSEGKSSSFRWKNNAGIKLATIGFTQFVDDWQETRTFTDALEKIESWIFTRIVESVWWQTLTPHMQSPVDNTYSSKSNERLLGPSSGDHKQGCFSINLWRSAFEDAFQKLCPVRAGGHECGCLPVLARMVMEQCVARLDVAMFNAILRESAHDIPTDPVSDPIVDSKVLPIPAGDLSFGSGAQLKNSVGNWSRWLTDMFGMEIDETLEEDNVEDNGRQDFEAEPKSFPLLNALSDLLMLPKDMLMDRSIRKEVCPSISLPLIKRILCNFTPDEFCPDPVPGAVLEALNAESIIERRMSDAESASSFPYNASPVVYIPPAPADVAVKVITAERKFQLERNVSIIQRKGYTSDEELDELESPLTGVIDKVAMSIANGNEVHKEKASDSGAAIRYELLREVWTA